MAHFMDAWSSPEYQSRVKVETGTLQAIWDVVGHGGQDRDGMESRASDIDALATRVQFTPEGEVLGQLRLERAFDAWAATAGR